MERSGLIGVTLALLAASAAHADGNYALDRALIEDLQARYLFALDFRDARSYAATFTEDGVLDYGAGTSRGRKAIEGVVEMMRTREATRAAEDKSGLRPAAGRHNITNIVISVQGDRATSVSYWSHMGNANPERKSSVDSFGHYEDELVRVKGEWLFTRRKIYNEQVAEWSAATAPNPVVQPGTGPKLRKPTAAAAN